MNVSTYFEDLEESARNRYKEKLTINTLNGTHMLDDPYNIIKSEWSDDPHKWPEI